ncbi:hypothetical protein [Arthrobacter sp. Soil763]|nr:hypothetical protein [Arthrobacter sp. Soil763]
MTTFLLMLATIGAAVWSAWAIRMDQADAAAEAETADTEWRDAA